MTFLTKGRSGTAAVVASPSLIHDGIKTIGHLVLVCAGVLIVSALLLVVTAFQVVQGVDRVDLAAEQQRAANAISEMVASFGPLTAESAVTLGRIASLRDAHLSGDEAAPAGAQQIVLSAGQGPAGSNLIWTRTAVSDKIFRQFAPIRLPIMAGMTIIVLGLLLWIRRLVADIDRQRRIAHQQSRSDPLTGLGNRLALDTAIDEWAAAGTTFAVLALDLDRFKNINDSYGHAAGDEVLRIVGTRLAGLLGANDLLARVGGDEFVIVCRSQTDAQSLAELAAHCIANIERPIWLTDKSVQVGVSIGIIAAEAGQLSRVNLMAMADAALYSAKSKAGSAFEFSGVAYIEPMQVRPVQRIASAG